MYLKIVYANILSKMINYTKTKVFNAIKRNSNEPK